MRPSDVRRLGNVEADKVKAEQMAGIQCCHKRQRPHSQYPFPRSLACRCGLDGSPVMVHLRDAVGLQGRQLATRLRCRRGHAEQEGGKST